MVISERFREGANEKACEVRDMTIYEGRNVLGKHMGKLGAAYDKSNARQPHPQLKREAQAKEQASSRPTCQWHTSHQLS